MESFAIGMLLGAAFVCIAAFFIGMLGGDVDISDIMHDNMRGYIKGSETDELYKMERLIVHEIVKRERSELKKQSDEIILQRMNEKHHGVNDES